jgi:hypothetical protein
MAVHPSSKFTNHNGFKFNSSRDIASKSFLKLFKSHRVLERTTDVLESYFHIRVTDVASRAVSNNYLKSSEIKSLSRSTDSIELIKVLSSSEEYILKHRDEFACITSNSSLSPVRLGRSKSTQIHTIKLRQVSSRLTIISLMFTM